MSCRPIHSEIDMPDPWVLHANGTFYLMFTTGDRLEIWQSDNVEDFQHARKSVVWRPGGSGWAPGIWAPELHNLFGAWYIYFSGERPGEGPASHRTLIVRSQKNDPMDPQGWEFLGPLQGVPEHWAIDATVFFTGPNDLYCCYSGWPIGDNSDTEQDLFLVKLKSPTEAIPETLCTISKPTHKWERPDHGRRGVNEGPEWVEVPGIFRGIVFSANGSWTCDYSLGLLALEGENPLDPRSWKKRDCPLLTADRNKGGPYGPGHGSFINLGNGQMLCMFHCTSKVDDGWANRKARCMLMKPQDFSMNAASCCCATGESEPMPEHKHGLSGFFGKAFDKLKSL